MVEVQETMEEVQETMEEVQETMEEGQEFTNKVQEEVEEVQEDIKEQTSISSNRENYSDTSFAEVRIQFSGTHVYNYTHEDCKKANTQRFSFFTKVFQKNLSK